MQAKTLVLMLSAGLAMAAVAFVPTAAAHDCSSFIPSDCGHCREGDHQHTYCRSDDPTCTITTTVIIAEGELGIIC